MIDKNKQYKTRDGCEVRIYATDGGGFHEIHGAIKYESGWWDGTWTCEGKYVSSCVDEPRDLIEVQSINLTEADVGKRVRLDNGNIEVLVEYIVSRSDCPIGSPSACYNSAGRSNPSSTANVVEVLD